MFWKYIAKTIHKERCVVCGIKTEYAFCVSIQARLHYIRGVGQLCACCYHDIYGKSGVADG